MEQAGNLKAALNECGTQGRADQAGGTPKRARVGHQVKRHDLTRSAWGQGVLQIQGKYALELIKLYDSDDRLDDK